MSAEGSIIIFSTISILGFIGLWLWSYYHRKKNKRLVIVLIGVISVCVILILGNYHIVLDTREVFIKRPYWGFGDIIGTIDTCTEIPYLVAMTKHASLCRALQRAGYLESEEAREKRIKKEVKTELEQVQKQIEQKIKKETEEREECLINCEKYNNAYSKCIRDCDEILYSDAYSKCVNACDVTSENYLNCINECDKTYSKKYSECIDGCENYSKDYSKCIEQCYY